MCFWDMTCTSINQILADRVFCKNWNLLSDTFYISENSIPKTTNQQLLANSNKADTENYSMWIYQWSLGGITCLTFWHTEHLSHLSPSSILHTCLISIGGEQKVGLLLGNISKGWVILRSKTAERSIVQIHHCKWSDSISTQFTWAKQTSVYSKLHSTILVTSYMTGWHLMIYANLHSLCEVLKLTYKIKTA